MGKRKRRKNNQQGIVMAAVTAAVVIIGAVLAFGLGIFENKTFTFNWEGGAPDLEDAVRRAHTVIYAVVGQKGETLREEVSTIITATDGTETKSVLYTVVDLKERDVVVGTDKTHTYELGGTYDGITYSYTNTATLSTGEQVYLLLDEDGFLVGEGTGKFTVANGTVTNSLHPYFSKSEAEFRDWIISVRGNSTPSPTATPTPLPTATVYVTPSISVTPSVSVTPTPTPVNTTPVNTPVPTPVSPVETSVPSVSGDDAVRNAAVIVRGDVISRGEVSSFVSEGKTYVYTPVKLRVSSVINGNTTEDAEITVRQLGGTYNGVQYIYRGEASFDVGEDVIVMLDVNNVVCGGAAGKYTVSNDELVHGIDLTQPLGDFIMGILRVLE